MNELLHPPAAPREWAPTLTWRRRGQREPAQHQELAVHGAYVIGRLAACDIPIADNLTASRRHAELQITAGKVRLTDVGSRNGTFVNGRQISGAQDLAHGQEFRIGDFIFAVLYPTLPGDVTPDDPSAVQKLGSRSGGFAEALLALDDEYDSKLTLRRSKAEIEEALASRVGPAPRTVSRRLKDLASELRVDPDLSGTRLIQAMIDRLRAKAGP
jgi:predicted component of type VI protein secretion system